MIYVSSVCQEGSACLFRFGPKGIGKQWCEARFPIAHSLVGKCKALYQEQLGRIPQAQLVARPPEHNQKDDVGREFQVAEGRVRAFIELPSTSGTAKGAIAKPGSLPQLFS